MANFSIARGQKEEQYKDIIRDQLDAAWTGVLHGQTGYLRAMTVEVAVQNASAAVQIEFWSMSAYDQ